ncbi:hypothetical protein QYE76_048406 [Lolium multiflorum]|uniref:CCHC-type domain-containing protein n=1 Tax=Lolium multiflorum TaxID=4521 RepID=A0AAD8WF18_LOLMU|nr:hypothetical protein QYE76_048406 [Lolium multiflorum]
MSSSLSASSAGSQPRSPVSIWKRIPSSSESLSPASAAPVLRRSDERPVVSGLGISDSSSAPDSPGVESGRVEREPAAEPDMEPPWERPPPSRKTKWRGRVEARNGTCPSRKVAPEMDDLCFKCAKDGHEAKDCKRPRSPPSEDELRRAEIAKHARQAPMGIQDPRHPRRQVGARVGAPRTPPPPPPPPPAQTWLELLRSSSPGEPVAQRRKMAPVDGERVSMGAPLCVLRRSRNMQDLERRLQHAVVAYVGGDRPAVTCAQVVDALDAQLGVPANRCSVHRYQPEDFLIVLASEELKNRVTSSPSINHAGFSIFVRPWARLAQATKVNNKQHVHLVLEGIPPHAWDKDTAEELLGTSCVLEDLAPATRERSDLALFRLSAWTDNAAAIPPARTLVIPEPEEIDEVSFELARHTREEVSTLRYKVLIHIDSVEDDRGAPFDAPGAHGGDGSRSLRLGGGGRQRRWFQWQCGTPDRRGGGEANPTGAGEERRTYRQVAAAPSDWRIPPNGGSDCWPRRIGRAGISTAFGQSRSNLAAPTNQA